MKFGSKIISFILGFVIGVVAVVGGVVGVGYIAATTDFDAIFGAVGFENKDQNGEPIINTDSENGGAKNLIELINKVVGYAGDYENLTLGQIDELFPVSGNLVETFANEYSAYVEVDVEKLKTTPVSGLKDFLTETINGVKLYNALSAAGMSQMVDETPIVGAIVNGIKAKHVVTDVGNKPVYVDVYTYDQASGNYLRRGDGAILSDETLKALLVEKEEGENLIYELNHYCYPVDGNDVWFATDAAYSFTANALEYNAIDYVYAQYNQETSALTGDYYVTETGEKSYYKTVGDLLASGNPLDVLDRFYVKDMFEGSEGNNELIIKVLGDVSVGSLLKGEVDLGNVVVSDVIDINAAESIMTYIAYDIVDPVAISDISSPVLGQEYIFKGVYKDHEITASNPDYKGETVYIKSVYTEQTGADPIYLVKSFYSDEACTVKMEVKETGMDRIAQKMNDVGYNLTLGDILNVEDHHVFLSKLADSRLVDLETDINTKLTLCDFLTEVEPSDALQTYLVYGVRDVKAATQTQYPYTYTGKYVGLNSDIAMHDAETCYLVVGENGYITGVYFDEACTDEDEGTRVGQVSERINGITKTLTIKEFMDVEGNVILKKLGNSTIDALPDNINNLSLQEISADSVYGNGAQGSAVLKKAGDEIAFDAAYLYYDADGNLVNGTGKLTSLPSDGEYYTYGAPVGTWKFMLYNDGSEVAYKITDLSGVMQNATANIKVATLDELADAGIVEMTEAELNKSLDGIRLGSCPLDRIIDIVIQAAQ
ncbi:MAG: hypothetical protein J6B04_00270 [Clostridia bacterium]|nr:hypothetical protein [Clostridia bacterium]